MIEYEDFPEICIKCKRKNQKLTSFKYSKTRGIRFFRMVYVKVPVCEKCELDFKKYLAYKDKTRYVFETGWIILFFSWFLGILWVTGIDFTILRITLLMMSFFTLLVSVLMYIKCLDHPHRISNYFDLNMEKTLFLKDDNYVAEFEDFQEKRITIENDRIIYCPNCGTSHIEGKDYCNKCGRELKYIKIKDYYGN